MGTKAKSDGGQTLWIILPLSYKRIINITVWCLTDCSCTYSVQHNVLIYKMRIYAVCIYAVWNTCGSRQNMTMCGGRAARFGFFFLLRQQYYRNRIASHCNYSVCLHLLNFFLFLSTAEIVITIQFNFYFFIFFVALLLCLPFHCMEFALRKSRNKSMRSYDRKQQCLFVFLLLTNETKSHLSNILKNLQTPRFVVFFVVVVAVILFRYAFFRFYYFKCMSINTHIAISYCNNRIFMHLFCDFKSMILA